MHKSRSGWVKLVRQTTRREPPSNSWLARMRTRMIQVCHDHRIIQSFPNFLKKRFPEED